jgi:hypothetical protein
VSVRPEESAPLDLRATILRIRGKEGFLLCAAVPRSAA